MILKKNIYIHIEILSRELASQLLLSIFAVQKNFRVYVGDNYSLKKILLIKKKREGIFIAKGDLDKITHNLVKEKCEKLISLDQEITPGFTNNYYENIIRSRYSPRIKDFDIFFCNNDQIKKNLIKVLNIKKNKIIASGWPRFDLYKEEFRGLYEKEVVQIKKKYKKFYLFTSDYGTTSKEEIKIKTDFLTKIINKNNQITLKKYPNLVKYIFNIEYNTKDFKNLKKFLKTLKSYKNLPKIIFRPHPNEPIKEWNKIKRIDARFIIEPPKKDISAMILASEGLIHRGCTTAFPSLLFNKKTGYLDLTSGLNKANFYRSILYKNSTKINSIKTLLEWFKKNTQRNVDKEEIKKKINLKRQYSSKKIISEINKLKISRVRKHKKFKLYGDYELKVMNYKNKIYNVLSYAGILKDRNYFKKGSQEKMGKNFNIIKINKYIKYFSKVLGYKKKINVSIISDNLFEIDLSR